MLVNASKSRMALATAVLLAAAAVGQAQQPEAQKAEARQATQPGAAASAAANGKAAGSSAAQSPASAQSSVAAQAPASGLSAELIKEARDDGFKPVTRHDVTLYCKSEIEVGSRFPIHTCYNEDRLKVVLQQYRAERMQLEQMHSGGMQAH